MKDGISPFRFWVQPILPLAYDDSLSYLEVLLKVKIKLNEVIDWANNYKDELYQYVDQKTKENLDQMQQILSSFQSEINIKLSQQDIKINNMEGRINGLLTTVNNLISQFQQDINNQIAQFQLETDTKIRIFSDQITQQINNNEAWVRAQIAAQTAYINAQLEVINTAIANNLIQANEYTDEKIKEALEELTPGGDTNVIYPGDNEEVTIQIAINRLFYQLSYFALTAEEYDGLELTAEEYDSKNLTAYIYDLWARWYLLPSGGSGEPGVTFTPSVSLEGIISWTNDGGLPNPDPVNIKGPKGDTGDPGGQGQPGTPGKDATINGVNTITMEAGTNINLSQTNNKLTISTIDTTYSQSEQLIGTWIDGKPLYKKTIVIYTTTQVTSVGLFLTLDPDWNYSLKRGYGIMYNTSWGSSYAIPYLEFKSNITHSYFIGESHTDSVNSLWISYITQYSTPATFAITVEYTKPNA